MANDRAISERLRITAAGQEAECERLDRLISDARSGISGAILVRGEAGVGKTALLDAGVNPFELDRRLG